MGDSPESSKPETMSGTVEMIYFNTKTNEKINQHCYMELSEISNDVICYSSDPSRFDSSVIIKSFEVSNLEITMPKTGINSTRTFALRNVTDNNVSIEFICPSNTSKLQWMKFFDIVKRSQYKNGQEVSSSDMVDGQSNLPTKMDRMLPRNSIIDMSTFKSANGISTNLSEIPSSRPNLLSQTSDRFSRRGSGNYNRVTKSENRDRDRKDSRTSIRNLSINDIDDYIRDDISEELDSTDKAQDIITEPILTEAIESISIPQNQPTTSTERQGKERESEEKESKESIDQSSRRLSSSSSSSFHIRASVLEPKPSTANGNSSSRLSVSTSIPLKNSPITLDWGNQIAQINDQTSLKAKVNISPKAIISPISKSPKLSASQILFASLEKDPSFREVVFTATANASSTLSASHPQIKSKQTMKSEHTVDNKTLPKKNNNLLSQSMPIRIVTENSSIIQPVVQPIALKVLNRKVLGAPLDRSEVKLNSKSKSNVSDVTDNIASTSKLTRTASPKPDWIPGNYGNNQISSNRFTPPRRPDDYIEKIKLHSITTSNRNGVDVGVTRNGEINNNSNNDNSSHSYNYGKPPTGLQSDIDSTRTSPYISSRNGDISKQNKDHSISQDDHSEYDTDRTDKVRQNMQTSEQEYYTSNRNSRGSSRRNSHNTEVENEEELDRFDDSADGKPSYTNSIGTTTHDSKDTFDVKLPQRSPSPSVASSSNNTRRSSVKYPRETEASIRRSVHVADRYDISHDLSSTDNKKAKPRAGTTYYQPNRRRDSSVSVSRDHSRTPSPRSDVSHSPSDFNDSMERNNHIDEPNDHDKNIQNDNNKSNEPVLLSPQGPYEYKSSVGEHISNDKNIPSYARPRTPSASLNSHHNYNNHSKSNDTKKSESKSQRIIEKYNATNKQPSPYDSRSNSPRRNTTYYQKYPSSAPSKLGTFHGESRDRRESHHSTTNIKSKDHPEFEMRKLQYTNNLDESRDIYNLPKPDSTRNNTRSPARPHHFYERSKREREREREKEREREREWGKRHHRHRHRHHHHRRSERDYDDEDDYYNHNSNDDEQQPYKYDKYNRYDSRDRNRKSHRLSSHHRDSYHRSDSRQRSSSPRYNPYDSQSPSTSPSPRSSNLRSSSPRSDITFETYSRGHSHRQSSRSGPLSDHLRLAGRMFPSKPGVSEFPLHQESFFEMLEKHGRSVSPGGFGIRSRFGTPMSHAEPIEPNDMSLDSISSDNNGSRKYSSSKDKNQGIDDIVRQELANFEARITKRLSSATPILEGRKIPTTTVATVSTTSRSRGVNNTHTNTTTNAVVGTPSSITTSGMRPFFSSSMISNQGVNMISNGIKQSSGAQTYRPTSSGSRSHSHSAIRQRRENYKESDRESHRPSTQTSINNSQYYSKDLVIDEELSTEAAEWHRLSNWLFSTGMGKYARIFKSHGITKLSVVELLRKSDLEEIMADGNDISIMLENIYEFSHQTKSLSEQAMTQSEHSHSTSNSFHGDNRYGDQQSRERRQERHNISQSLAHRSAQSIANSNDNGNIHHIPQAGSLTPDTPVSSRSVASVLSKKLHESIHKVLSSNTYDPIHGPTNVPTYVSSYESIPSDLPPDTTIYDHPVSDLSRPSTSESNLEQNYESTYPYSNSDSQYSLPYDNHHSNNHNQIENEITMKVGSTKPSTEPPQLPSRGNSRHQLLQQQFQQNYIRNKPSLRQSVSSNISDITTTTYTRNQSVVSHESHDSSQHDKGVDDNDNRTVHSVELEYGNIYDGVSYDGVTYEDSGLSKLNNLEQKKSNPSLSLHPITSTTESNIIDETGYSTPIPVEDLSRLLFDNFDTGNGKKFFELWDKAKLSSGYVSLSLSTHGHRSVSPSPHIDYTSPSVQATIGMEFYLLLYFATYAIAMTQPNDTCKYSMITLRLFVEKLSNIVNSNNSNNNSNNNQSNQSNALPQLLKSTDFGLYSGIVFVPNPQSNPSYAHLFKEEWRLSQRLRLEKYLAVMLSSIPITLPSNINNLSNSNSNNNNNGSSSNISGSGSKNVRVDIHRHASPVQQAILHFNFQNSVVQLEKSRSRPSSPRASVVLQSIPMDSIDHINTDTSETDKNIELSITSTSNDPIPESSSVNMEEPLHGSSNTNSSIIKSNLRIQVSKQSILPPAKGRRTPSSIGSNKSNVSFDFPPSAITAVAMESSNIVNAPPSSPSHEKGILNVPWNGVVDNPLSRVRRTPPHTTSGTITTTTKHTILATVAHAVPSATTSITKINHDSNSMDKSRSPNGVDNNNDDGSKRNNNITNGMKQMNLVESTYYSMDHEDEAQSYPTPDSNVSYSLMDSPIDRQELRESNPIIPLNPIPISLPTKLLQPLAITVKQHSTSSLSSIDLKQLKSSNLLNPTKNLNISMKKSKSMKDQVANYKKQLKSTSFSVSKPILNVRASNLGRNKNIKNKEVEVLNIPMDFHEEETDTTGIMTMDEENSTGMSLEMNFLREVVEDNNEYRITK